MNIVNKRKTRVREPEVDLKKKKDYIFMFVPEKERKTI